MTVSRATENCTLIFSRYFASRKGKGKSRMIEYFVRAGELSSPPTVGVTHCTGGWASIPRKSEIHGGRKIKRIDRQIIPAQNNPIQPLYLRCCIMMTNK